MRAVSRRVFRPRASRALARARAFAWRRRTVHSQRTAEWSVGTPGEFARHRTRGHRPRSGVARRIFAAPPALQREVGRFAFIQRYPVRDKPRRISGQEHGRRYTRPYTGGAYDSDSRSHIPRSFATSKPSCATSSHDSSARAFRSARQPASHIGRHGTEMNDHGGLAVALESRVRTRHGQVLDALDRLASGDYGICASCRRAIPYGRLMVMPETSYCKSCSAM